MARGRFPFDFLLPLLVVVVSRKALVGDVLDHCWRWGLSAKTL